MIHIRKNINGIGPVAGPYPKPLFEALYIYIYIYNFGPINV